MRSMMFFGLLMAAATPSVKAQESNADGAVVLTADGIELNLGTKERGVLSFDAVNDDEGGKKRLRIRLTQPEATFVLATDDEPNRRWLGVQVGEVPTPLGIHLGLDKSHGIMILNIIEDSPADAAGMKQYDVVVEVNGKNVKDGSRAFARSIRAIDDVEEIALRVIQAGKPRELKAILRTPPTDGKHEFKFKLSDEVELDRFRIRGGIADHGLDGWKFDWTDAKKIPLLGKIPHLGQLFVEKGRSRATLSLGDKSIQVEVTEDGDTSAVVVKKQHGPEGEVVERDVYENLEELKKGAPEAYEIFKKFKDGKSSRAMLADWITAESDGKVLSRQLLRRWKPDWEEIDVRSESEEVDRQFRVETDGRIIVEIKKGRSSVALSFANEAEMKEKNPKLHAHFKELLSE